MSKLNRIIVRNKEDLGRLLYAIKTTKHELVKEYSNNIIINDNSISWVTEENVTVRTLKYLAEHSNVKLYYMTATTTSATEVVIGKDVLNMQEYN